MRRSKFSFLTHACSGWQGHCWGAMESGEIFWKVNFTWKNTWLDVINKTDAKQLSRVAETKLNQNPHDTVDNNLSSNQTKSALYQIGYRTSRQPWRAVQATKLIYSEIKKIRMRTRKSRAVLQWLYWNKTQNRQLKPHKRDLKPQQLIKLKTTIESYYSAML